MDNGSGLYYRPCRCRSISVQPPYDRGIELPSTGKSPHARQSSTPRRLLLILAGLLAAAAVILAIGVYYLSRNPSAVKPLVEKALSMQTGTSVHIEHLEVGTDPLRLVAAGIVVSPRTDRGGFEFQARTLTVQATLSGPFGKRTLSIDRLQLDDYHSQITLHLDLPTLPTGDQPSLTEGLLKRLVGFFLFSDLAVQRVEALNGELAIRSPTQKATISIPRIRSDPDSGVHIDAEARIELADGRHILSLPEVQVAIAPPGLTTSRHASGHLQFRGARIRIGTTTINEVHGTSEIRYDPSAKKLDLTNLILDGQITPVIRSKGPKPVAFNTSFRADASYYLSEGRLFVSRWSLGSEGLLELIGSARLQTASPYPFRLVIAEGRIDSAGMLQMLGPAFEKNNIPLSAKGPITIDAKWEGQFGQPADQWKGSLRASLDQLPMNVRSGDYRLKGRINGMLQLTGSLIDPLLSAQLNIADAILAGTPVESDPFRVSIDASGKYPDYRTQVDVHSPRVALKATNITYRLQEVKLTSENGLINLQSGDAAFPAVAISSDTLRNLSLKIDKSGQGIRLFLEGRDTRLVEAAADWRLIPADWQARSNDRISATVVFDEQQQALVTARASLSDVVAVSADESVILEGLQVAADTSLRWQPKERKWASVAKFTVDKGEALVGRYYHDFTTNPLSLSGRGSRAGESQRITLDGLRLQLADLLEVQAYGGVQTGTSTPSVIGTILIPETELLPLYRQFVLEPYKFEHPSLETLSLGGRISGELQVAFPDDSGSIRGRIKWTDGYVSMGEDSISADGIQLDFPVWHQRQPTNDPPLPGSLRIAAMRLPLIAQQPLRLSFRAGPGTLATTAPVDIALGSGKLRLGTIRLASIYSGRPELATVLSVEAASLEPLLDKAGGICSGGWLNGTLDQVVMTGNSLTSNGTLSAEVCGGRIEIQNPGVDRPLSSSPVFRLDSDIEALDLEQLTKETSFGRIQGVLNGRIRNLEIVNGQPQSFHLLLETEKTRGVPQKINVRAVENIARLGGGGNPFMGLAGTVVTLFKEFSYSRIGVRASLYNDTFRINGTIRENEKEYLVKKGGLSGVDVVNLNPDNRISFKDMVKRIKRIQQSDSGPVVK